MRLGIYQCAAGAVDSRTRLADLRTRAAGLDLLVCPELFLSGYRAEAATMAEPQDGPFGQAVAAIAQEAGTAIAYGYPERDGAHVYNAAALYDAQGRRIANHRKSLMAPGSFEDAAFARGTGITFADLAGWRVAMIICYEVEFPEILRRAAMAGAELIIVPTALGADWGVVAEHVVPTRAFENGVWMVYADQAGAADGLRFYGGSRVAAPDGTCPAVAPRDPALITAEIDRATVARLQARLPYLKDCKELTC